MNLLKFLDNENIDLAEPIAIEDPNLSRPIYIGLVGEIPFSFLRNDIRTIDFQAGRGIYKEKELFYTFKVILNI